MDSAVKNVQYKESKLLYNALKNINSPFFVSRVLNIEKCSETDISNMLFNYRMLAFTKECGKKTEVVLYQLPSLEENGNVHMMLISDDDAEFVKESVSYIKKEFKTFAWEKIILEHINKNNDDIEGKFEGYGFKKNMCVPYQYGTRDIYSIEIV